MDKKLTIVAGGNSGIGLEIARAFYMSGSNVVILGRNSARNNKAVKSIKRSENSERKIHSYVCDMSSESKILETFLKIRKNFGRADNFINSVGLWRLCPITKITKEFSKKLHDNNFLPIILVCKVAPNFMTKGSSIVNLSSFAAIMPMSEGSIYAAYKSAVINFTKSAADELAQKDIRVNCVTPGVVDTPMTSDNIKKNKSSLLKPISLKSIGTPQQVAGTVKFLCSEDASYITGENIVISGGKYIVQK